MRNNERINLVKRNTVEIITEEKLKKVLNRKKKPVVYCGYEPSGPLHLGHFVTIMKLMDLAKAGFKVKILLADVHAFLNHKGNEEKINREIKSWTKTIRAIGLDCEIVLGSSFQFEKNYVLDVINLAQETTINRGLRSMQEIARDIKNATISQLWYPLMQVVDIKHLGVDVTLGGIEQRKVHMIGKDLSKIINYDFVALHTPLITSLKGPGQKMSSSVLGTMISIIDKKEEIKKKIRGAYCPPHIIEDNPILSICKLIIFPKFGQLHVEGAQKEDTRTFKNYEELEQEYKRGYVWPSDLKDSTADYLEKIIAPIRKNFK